MAKTIFLRLPRRVEAWATGDPQKIIASDFDNGEGQADLTPSVYEIEIPDTGPNPPDNVVRIQAEHGASFLSRPQRASPIDVSAAITTTPRHEEGETKFQFTNSAHRSYQFASRAELEQFVVELLKDLPAREFTVSVDDLRSYVKNRLDQHDVEWLVATRDGKPAEWKRAVEKKAEADAVEAKKRADAEAAAAEKARRTQWYQEKHSRNVSPNPDEAAKAQVGGGEPPNEEK